MTHPLLGRWGGGHPQLTRREWALFFHERTFVFVTLAFLLSPGCKNLLKTETLPTVAIFSGMCQLNEWAAAKYTQRIFCEKNGPNSPDLKKTKQNIARFLQQVPENSQNTKNS